MPVIRYIASIALYILLLPISTPAAFVVSLFTRPMPELDSYSWGGWFGTYDNPPQGDRKWLREHPELAGWRGYLNRVGWLRRNRLYGLKRLVSVRHNGHLTVSIKGNPDISDKYQQAGWLHASARNAQGKLIAFEWYSVTPYGLGRCVRIRLGWKIKGRKFTVAGDFAPLVFTFNPVDSFGGE